MKKVASEEEKGQLAEEMEGREEAVSWLDQQMKAADKPKKKKKSRPSAE